MQKRLTMQEIRRKALRAAAAAAGASMVACSSPAGTPVSGPAQTSDVAADSALAADSGTAAVDSTSAAADSAGPADSAAADSAAVDTGLADAGAGQDTGSDDAATADAQDPVDAADAMLADAGDAAACGPLEDGQPDCEPLQGKPEWGTCCADLGKWCQTKHPSNQEQASICQFGHNYSGKCTGCIPWGPPAPPAFDETWRPRVEPMGVVFGVV